MAMSGVQKTVLVTVAAIALVLGAVVAKVNRQAPLDRDVLSNSGIFLFDSPRSLPSVELQSSTGDTWTEQDLVGQWDLLFFGYTFCPDICPTTMADLRTVAEALPPAARERLSVTMVSVDPERDTPQQLSEYLAYFKAGFKGVTGGPTSRRIPAKRIIWSTTVVRWSWSIPRGNMSALSARPSRPTS